jgi:hypothetical protein
MIKIVTIMLLTLSLIACNPIKPKNTSQNAPVILNFKCLASQSACEIKTEHGEFTLMFAGQDIKDRIKTELPFYIKLQFDPKDESYQLTNIKSYMEGINMFMGKIPVFFQTEETKYNSMIAESLLVSCANEFMAWKLWIDVDITVNGEVKKQSFFIDFDTERP